MRARASVALLALALLAVAHAPQASADDAKASATAEPARVVIARFSTSYANDAEHKSRASNVELGAEAINGKTIAAGATFSFNDAVGERTAAFGYAKAVVLRDGMIAEGVGGGACQVASTLHAAALLAGLDVVARAPHSRPSAYIRMGLDATVALSSAAPAIDLKLKNSTAGPVVIRARAGHGAVEVAIEAAGGARLDVTLTSEILERLPFGRTVERDKRAKDDVVRVKAFGIPGYRVRRTREIKVADGTVKRDVRIDVYPPTNELVQVAPSLDESRIRLRAGGAAEVESPDRSADESTAPAKPVVVVVDDAAARPVLVQLRPSTRVVLDNATP